MQWRVEIGIFNAEYKMRVSTTTSQNSNYTLDFCGVDIRFLFVLLILLVCGDIELNLGPRKRDTCYNLSIWFHNLNSMAANNFEKGNLLEAQS